MPSTVLRPERALVERRLALELNFLHHVDEGPQGCRYEPAARVVKMVPEPMFATAFRQLLALLGEQIQEGSQQP